MGESTPERTCTRTGHTISETSSTSYSSMSRGGSSTMNTSWMSTLVIESFHALSAETSCAEPRRSGSECKSAWEKSCQAEARGRSASSRRMELAIQCGSSAAMSSATPGPALATSTPGAAAVICAIQPRSPSPLDSCQVGHHWWSTKPSLMVTRPARTNCSSPASMWASHFRSSARLASCSLEAVTGEMACT